MNKLIITNWNSHILTILFKNNQPFHIDLEPVNQSSILGNIYIGKVINIVKNIDSAFIDIGSGCMGYYSLQSNPCHHIFPASSSNKLKAGDELLVQVERDAVKTKAPVLSGNLNFTGRFLVLTAGKNHVGFSAKITDKHWKKRIGILVDSEKETNFGVIVRTNAQFASDELILEELKQLKNIYQKLMAEAAHRTCYSLLYQSPSGFITQIRDSLSGSLDEIITDDQQVYKELSTYMKEYLPEEKNKIQFYEDHLLPLHKLYPVESIITRALNKKVWLKSGGYLVIEQTEALVVIDINTGKYSGKKNLRETILKINLEAAEEIGKQLRLRNLSGIIIIDFIDMEFEQDKQQVFHTLSEILSKDPVKTTVVDMTQLNLVEVTRKKIKRPLAEQMNQI